MKPVIPDYESIKDGERVSLIAAIGRQEIAKYRITWKTDHEECYKEEVIYWVGVRIYSKEAMSLFIKSHGTKVNIHSNDSFGFL